VTKHAYAWRALERAGVRIAFGSDAPVEVADPLAGIAAATTWRREAAWHPELALTRPSALRAYTSNAAYAVGMEKEAGSLRAGRFHHRTQDRECPPHRTDQVGGLGVVELLEARLVRNRRHHRVAGVVRKLVQQNDRAFGAPDDELRILVIRILDDAAEKAARPLSATDVLHAPRRRQSLH